MALDLQKLATDTNAALTHCWADLGISEEERSSYLQKLAEDVASIYRSRVGEQETRRREKSEQVDSMISLIQGMQRAMEEADTEVRK